LLHLEDVFLTGLCAEVCNINRKHHTGFKPRGLDKKKIKLYVSESDSKLLFVHKLISDLKIFRNMMWLSTAPPA